MKTYYRILYTMAPPNDSTSRDIGRWSSFKAAERYINRWLQDCTAIQILQLYGDSIAYVYERDSNGEFVINYNAKLLCEVARR